LKLIFLFKKDYFNLINILSTCLIVPHHNNIFLFGKLGKTYIKQFIQLSIFYSLALFNSAVYNKVQGNQNISIFNIAPSVIALIFS
jgi:hypothetical protein